MSSVDEAGLAVAAVLREVRVELLTIAPIKGMALHHPDAVELRETGAVGDRAFFVVDESDKLLSLTRTGAFASLRAEVGAELVLRDGEEVVCRGPLLPGQPVWADFYGFKLVHGRVVDGPWTAVLSARAGQPVRLVQPDGAGGGIDIGPVTVLGSASVERLAMQAGEPVDPRRFRMLIGLSTDEPHVEDTWRGLRLVGEQVELRIGDPVARCAAITRDPDRGQRDQQLVRLIRDYRGMCDLPRGPGVPFGVYAHVLRPGRLAAGEILQLTA
jgi:MOSC domain-containing protein